MTLFRQTKEIKSKAGVLHFTRFAIIETKWFGIYIHKIYQADKDPFCHDHPWNFFGIVLKGGYTEQIEITQDHPLWADPEYLDISSLEKEKSFGSIGWGNRRYFHKISKLNKPTTTLFFTFGKKQPWGYQTNQGYVDSEEYRQNKQLYIDDK